MRNPSLPLQHWPDSDQHAWAVAITEDDILDGLGPAAHWRPATRVTNIHHYGRWLAFLKVLGELEHHSGLVERCTRESVTAYIAQLRSTVAPTTVASSIIGLAEILKVMAPDHDWRWLTKIASSLKRAGGPSRDKRARMLPSEEMYRIALQKLGGLAAEPLQGRNRLTAFRNLLMLALMIACPLRAKNFVALRLGTSLCPAEQGAWSIHIPADEHKNGYPLHLTVPERLTRFLEIYQSQVRPRFIIGSDPGAFWLTAERQPYDEHALYLLFIKITRRYFGKAMNPHLFRNCAATTMASDSLSSAMATRSLLGHQRFETTERHYINAEQLESSRRINEVMRLAKPISET